MSSLRIKTFNDGYQVVYILNEFEEWFKNGVTHRDGDKPAVISLIGKYWYDNGKLHRESNPAIVAQQVYTHGLNGVRYEEKHYWIRLLLMEY